MFILIQEKGLKMKKTVILSAVLATMVNGYSMEASQEKTSILPPTSITTGYWDRKYQESHDKNEEEKQKTIVEAKGIAETSASTYQRYAEQLILTCVRPDMIGDEEFVTLYEAIRNYYWYKADSIEDKLINLEAKLGVSDKTLQGMKTQPFGIYSGKYHENAKKQEDYAVLKTLIWGKIKEFLEIYFPANDFKSSYLLQEFMVVLKGKIKIQEDEILKTLKDPLVRAIKKMDDDDLTSTQANGLEEFKQLHGTLIKQMIFTQIVDDMLISGKNPMGNPYDHAVEYYNKWLQRVPVTRKMEIMKNKKELPALIQDLYKIKMDEGLMKATNVEEKVETKETEETENSAD